MTGLTYDENHNASGASNSSNKNISNSIQNSHYSIGLNNDVITDTKNPDYYKYDNLIKLNDINVANYTSVDLSNYSMAELVQESKKRALENGGISVDDNTNTYFVINNGEEIKVSRSGLIHSKSKASNDRKNLIINTGELLTNAIKVNEVVRNGKTSSVYFNEYVQDGNKYICRFIVNDDVLSDVIHKKLYAPSQYPIEKGRNSATGAPTSPFRIPSNISVKQMLEDVNSTSMIKRDLPLDVYYRFNDEYVAEGRDLEGYKYSIGESIRNLIDNDLDNDIETKQKQLDIILKENPVHDDYHTWIRGVDDIKTYEEVLKDSDYYEYLDDGFDESYTPDMVLDALERGEIKVYSSYPIKNGTFVTPSKMEAQSYAGEGKVYSKTVKLDKVAWIDPTQGIYADTSRKYSLGTSLNRLDSSKELKSKVVGYNS